MIGIRMKEAVTSQTDPRSAGSSEELLLICDARDGDVSSFNELVLRYQTLLYTTAFRILCNAKAAADATRDAFVSAHHYMYSFQGGCFKAWLVRFVIDACYDRVRSGERHPGGSLAEAPIYGQNFTALTESTSDFAERCELGNLIQRGLATIPADQRVTLVLADIDEFSYEQIAEITRANVGTVKLRLARARARLREFLVGQDDRVPPRYRHFQRFPRRTQESLPHRGEDRSEEIKR